MYMHLPKSRWAIYALAYSASLARREDFKTENEINEIYCILRNVFQNLKLVFAIFTILPLVLIKKNIPRNTDTSLKTAFPMVYCELKKTFQCKKRRQPVKIFHMKA